MKLMTPDLAVKRAAACALAAVAAIFCLASFADAAPVPRLKPPAPGPEYLSRADLERLKVIKSDVDRKNFTRAKAAIPYVEDQIARRLAEWFYFYGEDPLVNVSEAEIFLNRHKDWPAQTRIQAHVERRMSSTTPASQILSFFEDRDPVTGVGKLHLARAFFAQGDREVGEAQLRDAWRNDSFPVAEETKLLRNYAGRLRAEDHVARVDRLLWSRQVTAARRVFSRLPADERRRAEVRAALLVGAGNAGTRYSNLRDSDRADSGVMLAAVRYYRRQNNEPIAVAIARQAPTTPDDARDPGAWWYERQLLMRWALREKLYADAYAMAAGHAIEPGERGFADAEFDAGWIALRYLGEPERARTHFAALTGNVGTPISLSRGRYWMARAAEAMKDEEAATADYKQAAQYAYSYYGQLAAEVLGGDALDARFAEPQGPTPEEVALFEARPSVAALRMLTDLRDERAFRVFAYHIDDRLERPGEYRALAELAWKLRATHVAVRVGKVAVRRNAFAPEVTYPLIHIPEAAKRYAPEEVILGLSRQESEFNPRAYSRAGARGVMQLIPSTAQLTARKERLPYNRAALLNDADYNMTIGSAHLSHLFERFDGSWIMTFAAYNAGAGRVRQWIERYGDPRSPAVDPIDWIENIPFEETRNYVQRVMENTQVYRGRINEAPIPGLLARDLERGGAQGRVAKIDGVKSIGALPPLQPRILATADPILNPPAPEHTPFLDAGDIAHDDAPALETPPLDPSTADGDEAPAPRRTPKPALSADDAAVTSTAPFAASEPAPPVDADTADPAAPLTADPALDAAPGSMGEPLTTQTDGSSSEAEREPCQGYADYIAETEGEAATAADLNAGALAELSSDGGC